MELPDHQLIKLIRGGDGSLFALLVERYNIQIFNLMYRYSGSIEEARDLTQDVFCKAFEKLGRYKEKKTFFAWLYTLALNHARDWSRKHRRDQRKVGQYVNELEHVESALDSMVEARQDLERLKGALSCLAEDRREMVILRYRHERSIRDLADIFQLSESGVKMRLSRALTELGQIMEST